MSLTDGIVVKECTRMNLETHYPAREWEKRGLKNGGWRKGIWGRGKRVTDRKWESRNILGSLLHFQSKQGSRRLAKLQPKRPRTKRDEPASEERGKEVQAITEKRRGKCRWVTVLREGEGDLETDK